MKFFPLYQTSHMHPSPYKNGLSTESCCLLKNILLGCFSMKSNGLAKAIKNAGGIYALGRKLGISGQAVQQWRMVPANRVVAIERLTGVPRRELRPDLYAGMSQ